MSNEKEGLEFIVVPQRCVYNSEDFKVYACNIDTNKYPHIKLNKYKNVSIVGDMPELTLGVQYEVKAQEEDGKYGTSYKVINIRRDTPQSKADVLAFLNEILTSQQAETLYEVYPDIVQRVKENKLDDIDLSKTKGIKEKTFAKIVRKIEQDLVLVDLVAEFQGYFTLNMIRKIYEKYSNVYTLKKKLKNEPYKCLCGLSRVGFKSADAILLKLDQVSQENIKKGKEPIVEFEEPLISSKQRCLACILYLLQQNEEDSSNTKMNLVELRAKCLKDVPECANYFATALKECDDIYYNVDTLDVALKSTYDTEKYIAETITQMVTGKQNIWDCDVEKYRQVNGVGLSDEQVQIIENICKNNVNILDGGAGCVDCDTEYFNGYEWKRIADFTEGDKVLQYNEDGTAELVYPMNYIKRKADYLWHFKTKYGIDQCLSDNHNVYYVNAMGGKLLNQPFKDIHKIHNEQGFKGLFLTTFNYKGKGINLTDEQIEDFTETVLNSNQPTSNNLAINFPKSWYECNTYQAKLIVKTIIEVIENYQNCYKYTPYYFKVVNKQVADYIQFVFAMVGKRVVVRYDKTDNLYEGLIFNDRFLNLCFDRLEGYINTPITKYKTTDGYEYCFTVPSHILILRRNGKIFITGNCGKSFATQGVINMLKDKNISYKLFAPTGKQNCPIIQ